MMMMRWMTNFGGILAPIYFLTTFFEKWNRKLVLKEHRWELNYSLRFLEPLTINKLTKKFLDKIPEIIFL